MEEIIQKLKGKGVKMTPQRRAVVQALIACGEFPNVQRIFEHIKQSNPDISLDTVYRNLKLLTVLGLVSQINSPGKEGNIYELTVKNHHHHLICLSCGKAECLDYCPVKHSDLTHVNKNGFEILGHSLEIYGYCRTCKSGSKKDKAIG